MPSYAPVRNPYGYNSSFNFNNEVTGGKGAGGPMGGTPPAQGGTPPMMQSFSPFGPPTGGNYGGPMQSSAAGRGLASLLQAAQGVSKLPQQQPAAPAAPAGPSYSSDPMTGKPVDLNADQQKSLSLMRFMQSLPLNMMPGKSENWAYLANGPNGEMQLTFVPSQSTPYQSADVLAANLMGQGMSEGEVRQKLGLGPEWIPPKPNAIPTGPTSMLGPAMPAYPPGMAAQPQQQQQYSSPAAQGQQGGIPPQILMAMMQQAQQPRVSQMGMGGFGGMGGGQMNPLMALLGGMGGRGGYGGGMGGGMNPLMALLGGMGGSGRYRTPVDPLPSDQMYAL